MFIENTAKLTLPDLTHAVQDVHPLFIVTPAVLSCGFTATPSTCYFWHPALCIFILSLLHINEFS